MEVALHGNRVIQIIRDGAKGAHTTLAFATPQVLPDKRYADSHAELT